MIEAFWYLLRCSTRNRLIRQFHRLREPRYAIALLVGVAYLWFFLFQQRRPTSRTPSTVFSSVVPMLGTLGLFVAVVRWWLFGGERSALTFTPAEIQFLFPAPISRNAIIRWKLLRSQILILINAIIWTVIIRRSRPPIPLALYILALWTLFSTLSLHRLGASLTRMGLSAHWRTGIRRQLLPVLLASIAGVGLVIAIAGHWAQLRELCCGDEFWRALSQVLETPFARVVLFPFHLVMAPVASTTPGDWLVAMLPALLLLALHYAWVMRSHAAFEEAAVQASAELAQRVARLRGKESRPPGRGRARRAWLKLAPNGWPGTAILWKNTIAITRGSFSRSGVIVLSFMAIAFALVLADEHQAGTASLIGTMGLAIVGLLAFLGPTWIRNDLRQDLAYLGLLRSYPLRGRTVVLAEVMASALTLSALQCGFLLVAFLGLRTSPDSSRYPSLEATALLLPFGLVVLNAIGLTVQNAGALLFPAWVRFDNVRPGGFETMGQNILSSVFTVLLTMIGLIAPAVAGWIVWLMLRDMLDKWAAIPASILAVAIAAGEIWLLIEWLGRVFDRTESVS